MQNKRGFLVALVLVIGLPLGAQIITSTILGTVTDSSGAVIPNATITVKETATGFTRTVRSNDAGQYRAEGVPAGNYEIRVEKEGFATITQSNQRVPPQYSVRLDHSMRVGETIQVVEVAAQAALLQTETPGDLMTLETKQITELPALGGSYLANLTLSPGVLPVADNAIITSVVGQGDTGGNVFKPVSVSVSGGPPDLVAYVEDGFDVRDTTYGGNLFQPSSYAVKAVRIVRGFDTVQYGGQPSVVYTNTKSGNNEYHGQLYEFNQVTRLNAQAFGAVTRPPLTYNKAGVTVGGPVLPQLRNKTFFFSSFELTRIRSASVLRATVPSPAQWDGDLSSIPKQMYNPFAPDATGAARMPFPNNRIPTSLLSPVGQKIRKYFPAPTVPDTSFGQSNLTVNGIRSNDDTQYLIRIDQMLPKGATLFGKYFRDKSNAVSYGIVPVAGNAQPMRGQTASVEWVQTIGPTMVNQFRVGFFRSVTDFGTIPTKENIAGDILGFQNVAGDPAYWGPPSLSITDFSAPSVRTFSLHRLGTRGGFNENLSFVKGRHAVDLGFKWERIQYPQKNGVSPRGNMQYDAIFTNRTQGDRDGSGLGDLLLGAFSSIAANPYGFQPLLDTAYWASYVQDKIKLTRKLTVTLGVRWDWWQPPTERFNRWVAYDEHRGQVVFQLKDPLNFRNDYQTLNPDYPRGMFLNWSKRNFSPRVGLAYLVDDKTTVRAGFGIYYAQGMANAQIFSSFGNGAPPFANIKTVRNDPSLVSPLLLDTQLDLQPAVGAMTPGTTLISPDIHAPQSYVNQVTFSIQRQIGSDTIVNLGFTGTYGRHVMVNRNVNQASLRDPNNPLTLEQRRPNPFFAEILLQTNSGTSSYSGMYLQFEKRFSRGFNLMASYTFGKALDAFSSSGTGNANQIKDRIDLDWGRADFDRAHYVGFGSIWELPFGPGRDMATGGVPGALLRDWRITGTMRFMTGLPLTALMPNTWPNVGAQTIARPDRICDGNLSSPTMERYFDTGCYVDPPPNMFGNAGRNTLPTPGRQLYDLSVARAFPLGESRKLEFRADFYSVFNHQNWGQPNPNVRNPGFGQILSKTDPRRLSLSLRLEF